MELVGEILKKRRKDKNLTLFTISQELKISQEILNNIENNFLQHHIDSVFIIGHLRSYCSFLELNHNEMIELFKKQNYPEKKKNIKIERPKLEYKNLFSNKLISFSLIVGIFGIFYLLFIEVDKTSREYAIIPDLPEDYISIVEKANLDNSIINQNTKKKNRRKFC